MHLRQCEIVQDADKLKVDIQKICMEHKTIKKWAYILHDKDDTRPHYHIALYFGVGVDTVNVAKWFELGYKDDEGVEHTGEQFVERLKGRWTDLLLYLTHGNDTQRSKHQYSGDEVVANFDFMTEIESSKILGDFEHYSYAQQLMYVNSLPITEKTAAYSKLRKLWELHCQVLTLNSERSLQVVFICGKGGTGKTYYAKKLLGNLGYDYCISSSSNDPFQDYMGQKAIILDDLRDRSFGLDDLLKILDNDTSSSVKSRFSNKVFNGEMIVITSPVPLVYWYKEHRYNRFDNLLQLFRRISCYVVMTDEEITVYADGVGEDGHPAGVGIVYRNEVFGLKQEKRAKPDYHSIFGKICTPPTTGNSPFDAAEQLKITS